MPEWKAAKRVSVYLSMPSGEIETMQIVEAAFDQGKRVFVPYIYRRKDAPANQPKSIMDMLELSSKAEFQSFKTDKWGIPSIPEDSVCSRRNSFGSAGRTNGELPKAPVESAGLDLIVMPGMAFDKQFGRLGHGRGFYDFFLQQCQDHSTSDKNVTMPFLGKHVNLPPCCF